jgi:hypothetical protein
LPYISLSSSRQGGREVKPEAIGSLLHIMQEVDYGHAEEQQPHQFKKEEWRGHVVSFSLE